MQYYERVIKLNQDINKIISQTSIDKKFDILMLYTFIEDSLGFSKKKVLSKLKDLKDLGIIDFNNFQVWKIKKDIPTLEKKEIEEKKEKKKKEKKNKIKDVYNEDLDLEL